MEFEASGELVVSPVAGKKAAEVIFWFWVQEDHDPGHSGKNGRCVRTEGTVPPIAKHTPFNLRLSRLTASSLLSRRRSTVMEARASPRSPRTCAARSRRSGRTPSKIFVTFPTANLTAFSSQRNPRSLERSNQQPCSKELKQVSAGAFRLPLMKRSSDRAGKALTRATDDLQRH